MCERGRDEAIGWRPNNVVSFTLVSRSHVAVVVVIEALVQSSGEGCLVGTGLVLSVGFCGPAGGRGEGLGVGGGTIMHATGFVSSCHCMCRQ